MQALTERAIVWPAVLRAAIADVWEARDEAAKMRRSWQQADGALDEAAKENDRHIQRIVELEQQVQALQGELTHWQTCSDCGDKMAYPGHCAAAMNEMTQGLQTMLDESYKDRDRYRAERDAAREALGAAWDDGVRFAAEVLRSQVYPRAEARDACLARVRAALDQPTEPLSLSPNPTTKE